MINIHIKFNNLDEDTKYMIKSLLLKKYKKKRKRTIQYWYNKYINDFGIIYIKSTKLKLYHHIEKEAKFDYLRKYYKLPKHKLIKTKTIETKLYLYSKYDYRLILFPILEKYFEDIY